MKLTELNPQFIGSGGEGISDGAGNPVPERKGIGITFDCPCGCADLVFIPFRNPLDGGPPYDSDPRRALWDRTGEDFETLTLSPSIQRLGDCRWHGYITNGESRTL